MPEVPTPPLPTFTDVWRLGWRLYFVAGRVEMWGNDIKDVWMIGKWFYELALYIRDKIRETCDLLFSLDKFIRKMKRWIDGLIEGTTFQELLDVLSENYQKIRDNPVAWVRGQWRNLGWEFSQFLDDPVNWAIIHFRGVTYWFDWFLDNPRGYIIGQLKINASWFSGFLINPVGKVRGWAETSFPFLNDLWTDPSGVVVGWLTSWYPWLWDFFGDSLTWLDNRLRELSYPLWRFAHFPTTYIEEKLSNLLGINLYDMRNLWEWVLRKILANLTARRVQFESQIERTVGEVITWFL